MLIEFNFKNYRSFRDEASLSLSAAKITEFGNSVVSIGKEKILPIAAIYGANASGKSNVYNAFAFMTDYVKNSFQYGDDERNYEEIRPDPFLFDDESEQSESSFEVFFTIPGDTSGRTYNYGFSLGPEGVIEEWLNTKAKTAKEYKLIFYRGEGEDDFSGFPKKSRENIQVALEKQVLIVSLGAKLKVEKCKIVRDWFISNELANFGDPVRNFFMSRTLPSKFANDESVQENVIKFFSSFDDQIKGFKVTKVLNEDDDKHEQFMIEAKHKKMDSDDYAMIPLGDESDGTLKMFALYPELHNVMEKGSTFFVDELNARLHPLLVRNLILNFINPEININHAQLIFTIHDASQLYQFLRRDEIWFTEKDRNGLSTLYSLADVTDEDGLHIRKDENYEKNYLSGKYGAIPSLSAMNILGGEENGEKR